MQNSYLDAYGATPHFNSIKIIGGPGGQPPGGVWGNAPF
jgi:hypothetical protein